MKNVLFLLSFSLVCGRGVAQNLDSLAAVKVVDSLLDSTNKLRQVGKNKEALPLAQQAVDLAKAKWGEENARYAGALHRLASVYQSIGQNDEAERLYLKAIDLREKICGRHCPNNAGSLNNLGLLYMGRGDFTRAEPMLLEAKEISAIKNGRDSRDYASQLINLAGFYVNKGDFSKVEQLFLEAKKILAKLSGKEDPYYAMTLNSLGSFYRVLEDFEQAESLLLEATEIQSKTLGKEHPDYARSLNTLASVYYYKGDYARAEPLYLEAKEIFAKTLGKEHPDYINLLNNVGSFYSYASDYDKAEPMLLEAKETRAKTLGKEHPDYAQSLHSLAKLLYLEGDYARAEPLYIEAKEIRAKTLGKEHLEYAHSLHDLAALYYNKGDYTRAEPLYIEAKEIRAKILGKEHLDNDNAQSFNNLAILNKAANRPTKAAAFFLQANDLTRNLIEKSAAYSSEGQMLAYLHKFDEDLSQFQSFVQTHPSPAQTRASFDNALFFNSYLLENARRLARSVAGADSLIRDNYERWQGCRRRLAGEYAKPIAERRFLTEVEAEAESYEKTLTRNLAAFGETRRAPHWQNVREHLHEGEAAVEFIHYRYFDGKAKQTDSTMYAALLLLPGAEQPQFIPLFEEKQLEALLQTPSGPKSDFINNLYTAPIGQHRKTLYKLLWQPLEGALGSAKTVYFAPTGLLHRLNLAAVPLDDKATLADRYQFVELGSTRQLVVPQQVAAPEGTGEALLFGGIQYEMDSTAITATNADLNAREFFIRGASDFSISDSTLRGGAWQYLKWSEKEIATLEPILAAGGLKPSVRKGYAATEESFKTIGASKTSPRVLHLATHGFFFPDARGEQRAARLGVAEPVFKTSDNPMLRAGLILAGGNYAWKTGKPLRPGMDDGILTAYEISQMNLSGTELVVLSACETGLGDIRGNEGVYGLQRAFKIAGAKYLLMSLWQVSDRETAEFMAAFYQNWLEKKLPIPEAFRATQREMRERFVNPFLWAGFVLVE